MKGQTDLYALFLHLQNNNAEFNIKPYKNTGTHEIAEGYRFPDKAIWKIHTVLESGVEFIAVKTSKIKYIDFELMGALRTKNDFFGYPK